MNIILSNDDGFHAPGITLLRSALQQQHNVITVAPDRDRSGASNSLTLDRPLRLKTQGEDFYSVNGTPTDCVHLALTELSNNQADIVISGINAGANLGDDVLYSGTVAAAMEGRHLGSTAIAISLAGNGHQATHYDTAVKVMMNVLPQIKQYPDQGKMILNVNVPDIPWTEIRGFQTTRLGQRHPSEPSIKMQDPRGQDIYWIGPVGQEQDAGKGTDFHAIRHGFVSITPLHSDFTRHQALSDTQNWLTAFNKE